MRVRPPSTAPVRSDKLRDAEVESSNLPHPTKSEAIFGAGAESLPTSRCQPTWSDSLLVRGHKRFKAGAWWLTVNAKDPVTGKRKLVYATVDAPNNKPADSGLAKLVAQVETGLTMPTSGMTAEPLIER